MTYRITRSSPIAYRRLAQALANGEVVHWLQPIVCDCVKRKYLSEQSK